MKNYVEIEYKYKEDYLRLKPNVFKEQDTRFCITDVYGSLFYEDKFDDKPIYYFRHSNPDSYRFGGFLELGDSYLEPQKGGYHHNDVAGKETPINGYRLINKNPIEYGFDSTKPYSKYRYFIDHLEMEEANFFKAYAYPFPITIVDHSSIFPPMSQISQPCIIKGTYENKKVIGLGSYDLYSMPNVVKHDMGEGLGYFCASCQGIREDERKEVFIATINHSGNMCGIYWLEGEEPIISYQVKLFAEFEHLPYVDDGTCIYKDCIIEFSNISFHFKGKWGAKGFSKDPRIERHGQSHVFGEWYVGNEPYKHKLASSFMENMNCYDYVLKEMGYKVIG